MGTGRLGSSFIIPFIYKKRANFLPQLWKVSIVSMSLTGANYLLVSIYINITYISSISVLVSIVSIVSMRKLAANCVKVSKVSKVSRECLFPGGKSGQC